MKQKLCAIILTLALLTAIVLPVHAAQAVGVTIDSKPVPFTQSSGSPFIDENSRTLVPLRAVMETYGCKVDWDKDTRTASVTQDGTTVLVPIGKKQIQIGNTTIATDTAAQIKDGRTYLPIRAVLEAFGAAVGWDGSTRTVTVLHPEKAGLRVHFLDVGQADCILITAGTEAMLIDAGNNDDAETITTYLHTHGVTKLKYAVGTHPHEDHIGSLDAVLYAVTTENVLMPKVQTNTKTFEDVLDAILTMGLTVTAPKAGDTYKLGNAVITAVSNYTGDDLNNASIMLHLTYGSTSFLFTGDAEQEAEKAALQTGLTLDCDVLKVGHHGSRTSSSFDFLTAASPAYAVISCGVGNDYGHPHAEAMSALAAVCATVCRTDTQGTIIATSDGTALSWNAAGIPALVKDTPAQQSPAAVTYVCNTSTMKFHLPTCESVPKIAQKNRADSAQNRQTLLNAGFSPCGNCKP